LHLFTEHKLEKGMAGKRGQKATSGYRIGEQLGEKLKETFIYNLIKEGTSNFVKK
jgi:hypothetical protein